MMDISFVNIVNIFDNPAANLNDDAVGSKFDPPKTETAKLSSKNVKNKFGPKLDRTLLTGALTPFKKHP